MSYTVITILTAIFTIITTVLACIFIIPEKRRNKLSAFGKFLQDVFNFKSLLIEKILKFFYVFATAYVILNGFFMLFMVEKSGYYSSYYGHYIYNDKWVGYYGFLVMLLGPIVVRITYEFLMMMVLAVKNIIEINNKLGEKKQDKKENAPSAPVCKPEAETTVRFCALCGTRLNENGQCDHCQK